MFEKYVQLTKFDLLKDLDLLTFVPQCFIKQIGFQLSFIPISVRTKLGLHGYGHLFQVALKKLQDCLKQFYQIYVQCTDAHTDAPHTHVYGEFYWFDGTLTDPKLI